MSSAGAAVAVALGGTAALHVVLFWHGVRSFPALLAFAALFHVLRFCFPLGSLSSSVAGADSGRRHRARADRSGWKAWAWTLGGAAGERYFRDESVSRRETAHDRAIGDALREVALNPEGKERQELVQFFSAMRRENFTLFALYVFASCLIMSYLGSLLPGRELIAAVVYVALGAPMLGRWGVWRMLDAKLRPYVEKVAQTIRGESGDQEASTKEEAPISR